MSHRSLEQAVRWAAAVQRELLRVDWPKGLLEWAECAPDYDEDGVLLWRGPRVKVGMAVGHDAAKRPLNTGVDQGPGPSHLLLSSLHFFSVTNEQPLIHPPRPDHRCCHVQPIAMLRIATCTATRPSDTIVSGVRVKVRVRVSVRVRADG